jgi:hypothetical protein
MSLLCRKEISMALERDEILADNLRESLNLYQRSLVWAMTAAAAFFIFSLSLGNPMMPSVPILYGELSRPIAWMIALGLSFVLGILAGSALGNANATLSRLSTLEGVKQDVLDDILLYPSLATNTNSLVRFGTILFSPVMVLIGFSLEISREWAGGAHRNPSWWLGLAIFVVIIAAPYVGIATQVRQLVGSWHNNSFNPTPR